MIHNCMIVAAECSESRQAFSRMQHGVRLRTGSQLLESKGNRDQSMSKVETSSGSTFCDINKKIKSLDKISFCSRKFEAKYKVQKHKEQEEKAAVRDTGTMDHEPPQTRGNTQVSPGQVRLRKRTKTGSVK